MTWEQRPWPQDNQSVRGMRLGKPSSSWIAVTTCGGEEGASSPARHEAGEERQRVSGQWIHCLVSRSQRQETPDETVSRTPGRRLASRSRFGSRVVGGKMMR